MHHKASERSSVRRLPQLLLLPRRLCHSRSITKPAWSSLLEASHAWTCLDAHVTHTKTSPGRKITHLTQGRNVKIFRRSWVSSGAWSSHFLLLFWWYNRFIFIWKRADPSSKTFGIWIIRWRSPLAHSSFQWHRKGLWSPFSEAGISSYDAHVMREPDTGGLLLTLFNQLPTSTEEWVTEWCWKGVGLNSF